MNFLLLMCDIETIVERVTKQIFMFYHKQKTSAIGWWIHLQNICYRNSILKKSRRNDLNENQSIITIYTVLERKSIDTLPLSFLSPSASASIERELICGMKHNKLKSCISGRRQVVHIDGVMSCEEGITYGVPQGTVLGLLLFNIYINSLFRMQLEGTILSFAHDTSIFYTADIWQHLKVKS